MKNGRTAALLLQLLAVCAHLVCAFRHTETPVEGSGPDARFGRLHAQHPVQNCCMGETCLNDRSRFAVVTTVRSPEYMMGLRELTCSFTRHNPNVRLIVVGAASDAQGNASWHDEIRSFADLHLVEDLRYPNSNTPRFSLNWIKLRLWQWIEYDSLLILDADTVVMGDLTHLFRLPTPFAWAQYTGADGFDSNRGGLIMMRPCMATYHAMMHITEKHEEYQFQDGLSEQGFLNWFFRYSAYSLPLRYNVNLKWLDKNGLEPGGAKAVMVHFADPEHKQQLFHAKPQDSSWQFLCYQPQHYKSEQAGKE